jgi:hypothetical protein
MKKIFRFATPLLTFGLLAYCSSVHSANILSGPYSNKGKVNATADIKLVKSMLSEIKLDTLFTEKSSYDPGEFLALKYAVRQNRSTGDVKTSFYLSKDSNLDSNDVLLHSTLVNFSYDTLLLSDSTTIPDNTLPGDYYLIGMVYPDDENDNPVDNQFRLPVKITSSNIDLTVAVPDTAIVSYGRGYQLTGVTINNLGTSAASYYPLSIFVSADSTWDLSDTLLTVITVAGPIVPDQPQALDTNFYIPALLPGKYYVLFKVNHNNVLPETNLSNNVAFLPLTILHGYVDLAIGNPSLYRNVVNHSGFQATFSLTNKGNITTDEYTFFYLSEDSLFSSDDKRLNGAGITYGIDPGETIWDSVHVGIPEEVTAGQYFVIMRAFPSEENSDINETNDYTFLPFTLGPKEVDLLIQSPKTEKKLVIGTAFPVSYTLSNLGAHASANTYSGFYLSKDTHLDSGDIVISQHYIQEVPAKSAVETNSSIFIPEYLAKSGNYFLLFVADVNNSEPETNENNNVAFKAITLISPVRDLEVKQPFVSAPLAKPGDSLGISSFIYNLGNIGAYNINVNYYLSEDKNYSDNDIYLGTSYGNLILPKAPIVLDGSIFIPSTLKNGNYYIIFFTDPYNYIAEINESNNFVYKGIKIRNAVAAAEAFEITGTETASVEKEVIEVLTAFPNPASDQVEILLNGVDAGMKKTFSLRNMLGEEVKNFSQVVENPFTFPVDDLQTGIYMLHVNTADKNHVIKIIKK